MRVKGGLIVRWAMCNQAESDDSQLFVSLQRTHGIWSPDSGLNATFEQLFPSLFPPHVNHWLMHILADSLVRAVE